jgi:hypothetical protein
MKLKHSEGDIVKFRQVLRVAGLISTLLVSSASYSAVTVLSETFEDGLIDPRITLATVGTFSSLPGVKALTAFGSEGAFGFGRSTNRYSSFMGYVTRLIITFDQPTAVTTVSFKEMELFDNWGSGGDILADGSRVGGSPSFGRFPYNDRHADSVFRVREFSIDQTVTQVVLRVHDITDLSEIYIDDLVVTAVPEPEIYAMLVAGLGLIGFMVRRRV